MFREYYMSIDIRDEIIIGTFGYKKSKKTLLIEESRIYKDLSSLTSEINYLKNKIKKKIKINLIYNDDKSENFLIDLPNIKNKYKRTFIENKLKKIEDKDSIVDYGNINKDRILVSKIATKKLKIYLKIFEEEDIKINKIGNRLEAIIRYLYFYRYIEDEYIVLDINKEFTDSLYFRDGVVEIQRFEDIIELDYLKNKISHKGDNFLGVILSDSDANKYYEDLLVVKKDLSLDIFSPSIGNII